MPLVPPTRRNWDRGEVLKLEGTTISWPPHGWKKMSSDQRKLTWEFAATAIELKTCCSMSSTGPTCWTNITVWSYLAPRKMTNTPTTTLVVK